MSTTTTKEDRLRYLRELSYAQRLAKSAKETDAKHNPVPKDKKPRGGKRRFARDGDTRA